MEIEEGQQYLGVDWGEKRIGLALADAETRMALPFKTVADLKSLLGIIIEEEIGLVVIGSPRKMGGAVASNPSYLNFLKELRAKSAVPVVEVDERLSSKAVDALSGEKRDKAGRDEVAAALFLQDYLDLID
ncbi:Holliday junction resolvase RuvX [Candidatus Falkowbacteria bacterium HGW-Falkowbacteria-2]|uniref:Putative pre-16S rRNA nuclease n=1 Tax=Candidatus Falkowbacteria bacterium HGW-Falkowbacteria-2 TaxID=2013769 RepID=A0A2N2E312_9BACT|nr:MAG: Holliday junction resolvase RuvX [Candidatus Falkowbacteria bacterium HGW-Falkowbacteria-2]